MSLGTPHHATTAHDHSENYPGPFKAVGVIVDMCVVACNSQEGTGQKARQRHLAGLSKAPLKEVSLRELLSCCPHEKQPLSPAVIDISTRLKIKSINDTPGILFGDAF